MAMSPSHNGTGSTGEKFKGDHLPTLFRLLTTLAILAGLVYGSMYALVLYVEPKKGEMTVRIPPERLNPPAEIR